MHSGDAKTAAADSRQSPSVLHEDEGRGVSGDEEQKVKADDEEEGEKVDDEDDDEEEENNDLSWMKSSGGCDLVPYFV
jgi:hypothetical protein